ncbi:hypothetical protein TrRE_jg2362 [Triparma retinervis]|uniref:Uncharacterized protein n=1 Tax=Triparma retinervis TaxID=2557542 RepID=A0A9W7FX62_9STRA|nr:hypothetical protein TrRE_jg2362 [Triparma retinervis]
MVAGGELEFDVGVTVVKRSVVGKEWGQLGEKDERVARAVVGLMGEGMMSVEEEEGEEEEGEGSGEEEEGDGEGGISELAEEIIDVLLGIAAGEGDGDGRRRRRRMAYESLGKYGVEEMRLGEPTGIEGGGERKERILEVLRLGVWGEECLEEADAWGRKLAEFEQSKTGSMWKGGKVRVKTASEVMLSVKECGGRTKEGWELIMGKLKMPFEVGVEIMGNVLEGDGKLVEKVIEGQCVFRGADKRWKEVG